VSLEELLSLEMQAAGFNLSSMSTKSVPDDPRLPTISTAYAHDTGEALHYVHPSGADVHRSFYESAKMHATIPREQVMAYESLIRMHPDRALPETDDGMLKRRLEVQKKKQQKRAEYGIPEKPVFKEHLS
jgi:hypothetical protein